jgi:hypothetical protein
MESTTKVVAGQAAQVHTSEVLHINGMDLRIQFSTAAFGTPLPEDAAEGGEMEGPGRFRFTPTASIAIQAVTSPALVQNPQT